MDDLVIIILTLLVAGIGIIGQAKKRKTADQQPQAGKAPQNFWDMLESQIQPEQQYVEENDFIDDDAGDFESEIDIVDVVPPAQTYTFNAKNEGKSRIKENTISEILEKETKKTKKEKFPLRKAVIYSEILKNKYI